MDINIVGLRLGITDRFRDYATEKAEKVSHLAHRAQSLEIKVMRHSEKRSKQHAEDRVELTLIGPGPVIRAEAAAGDKYSAFDIAYGRLMERLRRARDRKKIHRGGNKRPTSLREVTTGAFSALDVVPAGPEALSGSTATATLEREADATEQQDDYCPVVIRRKLFASAPMTVDDALYYMELVGHDFYLFIDKETARPSVVYRRKGWDYGLISLDDEADESQEEAMAKMKGA